MRAYSVGAAAVTTALALMIGSAPASAAPPSHTTETVEGETIPAFRANQMCEALGYVPNLTITFDRAVKITELADGGVIERVRITGSVEGPEGTARFHAVRLFFTDHGPGELKGLFAQYVIPGVGAVVETGFDPNPDPEKFRPLCEAVAERA